VIVVKVIRELRLLISEEGPVLNIYDVCLWVRRLKGMPRARSAWLVMVWDGDFAGNACPWTLVEVFSARHAARARAAYWDEYPLGWVCIIRYDPN
jgi:hypothetical protein